LENKKAISCSYLIENILLISLLTLSVLLTILIKIIVDYVVLSNNDIYLIFCIALISSFIMRIGKNQLSKQNYNTVRIYKIDNNIYQFNETKFSLNDITSIEPVNKIIGLKEYDISITKTYNNVFNDTTKYSIRIKENGIIGIIRIVNQDFDDLISTKI